MKHSAHLHLQTKQNHGSPLLTNASNNERTLPFSPYLAIPSPNHEDQVEHVKTCDSLLIFSSEVLDLGLKQEVVDIEGDVGDGEDEDLDSEQKNLARDELCGLQCGGR
jgi:hypothetical protein